LGGKKKKTGVFAKGKRTQREFSGEAVGDSHSCWETNMRWGGTTRGAIVTGAKSTEKRHHHRSRVPRLKTEKIKFRESQQNGPRWGAALLYDKQGYWG